MAVSEIQDHTPDDPRERVINRFLELLAERPFERIGLVDVAARAEVSLAELRALFGSTFDIVAGFVKRTDRLVLEGSGEDMADQSARDRLFDVLMRRLDVLGPHKAAIASLARSARTNLSLAMGLNRLGVRSHQWMLASAGIETSGLKGAVRAQGLALLFARVLTTFVKDDEPDLSRTMAALDRELARGERALGLMSRACRRLSACRRPASVQRHAGEPKPDAPAAA